MRPPLARSDWDERAQVAELVDALASGASGLTAVKVRVLSWAPASLQGADPNRSRGLHRVAALATCPTTLGQRRSGDLAGSVVPPRCLGLPRPRAEPCPGPRVPGRRPGEGPEDRGRAGGRRSGPQGPGRWVGCAWRGLECSRNVLMGTASACQGGRPPLSRLFQTHNAEPLIALADRDRPMVGGSGEQAQSLIAGRIKVRRRHERENGHRRPVIFEVEVKRPHRPPSSPSPDPAGPMRDAAPHRSGRA